MSLEKDGQETRSRSSLHVQWTGRQCHDKLKKHDSLPDEHNPYRETLRHEYGGAPVELAETVLLLCKRLHGHVDELSSVPEPAGRREKGLWMDEKPLEVKHIAGVLMRVTRARSGVRHGLGQTRGFKAREEAQRRKSTVQPECKMWTSCSFFLALASHDLASIC